MPATTANPSPVLLQKKPLPLTQPLLPSPNTPKLDPKDQNPGIALLCGNLLAAGLPGEVDLLSESNGGIVIGDLANSAGVGAGERNAVVDVEDTVGAARRVDVAGSGDLVGLGVDLALSPDAATADGGLGGGGVRGRLGEVVGAEEGASHTGLEQSIAVVRALENGELEATGILCIIGSLDDIISD